MHAYVWLQKDDYHYCSLFFSIRCKCAVIKGKEEKRSGTLCTDYHIFYLSINPNARPHDQNYEDLLRFIDCHYLEKKSIFLSSKENSMCLCHHCECEAICGITNPLLLGSYTTKRVFPMVFSGIFFPQMNEVLCLYSTLANHDQNQNTKV